MLYWLRGSDRPSAHRRCHRGRDVAERVLTVIADILGAHRGRLIYRALSY